MAFEKTAIKMDLSVKKSLAAGSYASGFWVAFYFLQALLINTGLGYPLSIIYAIAFACLLLLLWAFAPLLQKGLIAFWSLIAALYLPFGLTFGSPNFNTLLALHSTSLTESSEMVTLFPWYSYVASLMIMVLGVIACRRKRMPRSGWRPLHSLCLVISLVCVFITPLTNLLYGGVFKLVDSGYPVFRFSKDVIVSHRDVLAEQGRMLALTRQKDSWSIISVKPKYQVYVVVIGESARRDALGAFGGHWHNTPFASQVNGTFFTDYIAASASTQKSLGLTLNRVEEGKPLYQDSFITLANRAGLQTWWFSNQGQIGQYDTAIASIAKRADEVHFLKNGNFEADKSSRDEDLLKMTAQVLSTPPGVPQLMVLHLMGSHPKTCDRTQGYYSIFVQSSETSCYLQSITQTDDLLHKLYDQLQNSGRRFSLVYFSDHGLAFRERGTRLQYLTHDDKFKQSFQVPFMVLSSDDTQHQVIKARRSANDFLSFFAQWTGIKTAMLPQKYRFISEEKAQPVYVTNFVLDKVNYDSLQEDLFSPASP